MEVMVVVKVVAMLGSFKQLGVLVERKAGAMVGSKRMWRCWRSTPHPALWMLLGRWAQGLCASKLKI